jgi:hypothetical protein
LEFGAYLDKFFFNNKKFSFKGSIATICKAFGRSNKSSAKTEKKPIFAPRVRIRVRTRVRVRLTMICKAFGRQVE